MNEPLVQGKRKKQYFVNCKICIFNGHTLKFTFLTPEYITFLRKLATSAYATYIYNYV